MPLALDEVLRDHWRDFARRYETRLAAAHHRAARAVMSCRTPVLGGHVWQCGCHHHHVHYAYDKSGNIRLLCHESGSNRPHVITLGVDDFLKRWLTRVLPQGFVRVRHHGWMSGAARKTRLLVRALVCGQLDEPKPVFPEPPVPRCPHCGVEMKLLAVIQPRGPPIHPK